MSHRWPVFVSVFQCWSLPCTLPLPSPSCSYLVPFLVAIAAPAPEHREKAPAGVPWGCCYSLSRGRTWFPSHFLGVVVRAGCIGKARFGAWWELILGKFVEMGKLLCWWDWKQWNCPMVPLSPQIEHTKNRHSGSVYCLRSQDKGTIHEHIHECIYKSDLWDERPVSYSTTDEAQGHYVKWNKPGAQGSATFQTDSGPESTDVLKKRVECLLPRS